MKDDHRLLRHVPPTKRNVDPATKRVTLFPEAFKLQAGEDALSASWVEYFEQDAIEQSMHDLSKHIEVRKTHYFALGRISDISAAFELGGVHADIIHDSLDYPSHVSLGGIAGATEVAYERLADSAWCETLPPTDSVVQRSKALSEQRKASQTRGR